LDKSVRQLEYPDLRQKTFPSQFVWFSTEPDKILRDLLGTDGGS